MFGKLKIAKMEKSDFVISEDCRRKPIKIYEIDFDKVENIKDIVEILKAFNLKITEGFMGYDDIKHLLKETV